MLEALQSIPALGWTAIVAGALTLVQISPIKIDPWSWLARQIGKAFNQEMLEKQDEFVKESKEYRKNNDARIQSIVEAIEKRTAEEARNQILRFGDEIKNKQPHSQEYYNQILADMTDYEKYCHEHPEFKNERTVATEQVIRDSYSKHMKNNDFL